MKVTVNQYVVFLLKYQLFSAVCQSLISNGERYEEESFLGRARLETLRSLCRMCPNQMLMIRLKCVRFGQSFHKSLQFKASFLIVQ